MPDIVITPGSNDVNSSGGTLVLRTSDAQALSLKTNNTDALYINSGGNVGIGTTIPTIKLAVDGEASFGSGSKLTLIGLDINSGSTPSFLKIRTKIPFASASADFTVNIRGFRYNSAETTNLSICWHYYNSTFWSPTISSAGGYAPTVKLSAEDWDSSGTLKVCIVLVSPGYWPKLYVESMYSSNYNDAYAYGWDWVDADATGTGNNLATLSYKSNFGNSFVMLSDGNVGIGTSSPGFLLDVVSTSATPKLRIGNAGSNNGAQLILAGSNTTKNWVIANQQNVNGALEFTQTTANGGSSVDTTSSMVINSSGNVGIGTTSPAGKLDVRAGSGGEIIFGTYDANYIVKISSGDQLNFYNGATATAGYINYGGGATVLSQNLHVEKATGGTAGLVRIKADGNVGIGTTSPARKLDVVGELRFASDNIYLAGATNYIRSDNTYNFLTVAGAAQTAKFAGIQVSSSYTGTIPTDGILFGTDTNIYRSAADTLKTDDNFIANASVGIGGSTATTRVLTITNVSATDRPAIKIVNPNFYSSTSSTGRTFYRWMPIDIDGTTYWIPIYSA